MGRAPCCSKVGLRRGPWTLKEDSMLVRYIQIHGEGHWRSLPKKAGLLRCGKSCRLRWMNYLRPDIKRGNISPDEDDLIIRLHSLLGNRWSLIAGRLPGRTDNEIKNYWNSHLSKKVSDPNHNTAHGATAAAKGYRGPKRRTTPKTSRIDRSKKDETIAKIKVHQPKATRISLAPSPALLPYNNQIMPRNTSIDSGSSSTEERADQLEPSNNIKDNDNNIVDGDQEEENDFANILINCVSDLSPSSSYSWHENNQIFLPGIDNADIAAASTSSSNSDQNKDSDKQMLEKIFEEYQELLRPEDHVQLESFVDSLLI